MCILDLSEVLMYEFLYIKVIAFVLHYIKNKYGNKSRLIFTDTDSLMYEMKTNDVYEDFREKKEIFDFSNY